MSLFLSLLVVAFCSHAQQMEFWLTDSNQNILFQQQPSISPTIREHSTNKNVIEINTTEQYQTIDGFGFALTGGSAMHLYHLDNATRSAILTELFCTDKSHIGVSYLRLSIGSSDLNEAVYSYDDLAQGETDPNMTHFSLDIDRMYVIPVLKQILAINSQIKLLGSPWSPPVWMKNNQASVGGSLLPQYYDAYALYFVRYVQAMQKEGINIDVITIQNEPLSGTNNPSMVMHAEQQAQFIKQSLGPAFRQNSIKTKILIYDHNPNRPDYSLIVLQDREAKQYIDGSAFHLYGGPIEALSLVHDAHPDKNIYFTERGTNAPEDLKDDLVWHVKMLIVGATRNWARTVLEWNLAADRQFKPHTPGGCSNCLGALTIDGNEVLSPRNPSYYIVAHAAKFIRPNSVRIGSSLVLGLPNVAFQRHEDGRRVLVVVNENDRRQITFEIQCNGQVFTTSLNGSSVGTYIW
jgi:glucosylceramidase